MHIVDIGESSRKMRGAGMKVALRGEDESDLYFYVGLLRKK